MSVAEQHSTLTRADRTRVGSGRSGSRPATSDLSLSTVPAPPSPLGPPLLRPLVVPAHHVELRAHPVRRLRSGAVVLALEAQQRRRHAAHLERRVVLLGLRHRRAQVELARHEQRRRLHVADVHQRRVLEPRLRILPEWLLEQRVGEQRDVGVAGHAHPVDHRTAHGRRREAIGVADHPAREHAAAAAAADVHAVGVDVALRHRAIDRGHQVVVVRARIVVIDRVAERRAVAGRSARIRVEHDETVRGEVLIDRVERRRCTSRAGRRESRR